MDTYKEKYEALLANIKAYHARFGSTCNLKKELEECVPELAESEDEKIRMELLVYFTTRKIDGDEDETWHGHSYDSIIAFLEKQKEQPKEELVYRLNGLMQDYIKEGKDEEEKEHRFKCYKLFWDALEDADFFEQKEQKPSTDETELNSIAFLERLGYTCIPPEKEEYEAFEDGNATGWRRKEQKPAEGITHAEIEQAMDEVTKFKVFAADMAKRFNITHRRDIDWHNFCAGLLTYLKVNQPVEWSEEDEENFEWFDKFFRAESVVANGRDIPQDKYLWFKSLRPQPNKEIYKAAKHDLAIKFMNYLDENRPEGKMSLSNSECEDIDNAFKENDWAKILRYAEKYGKEN